MAPCPRSKFARALRVLVVLALPAIAGCRIHKIRADSIEKEPQAVTSPVKAHLVDGSVVVFPDGVVIVGTEMTARGAGIRYDLRLENPEAVVTLPLDEVAAMQSFSTPIAPAASAAGTGLVGGAVLVIVTIAAILVVFAA